jgi:TRAP-type C4-dicarboxylate transport system permease small subunit
MVGTRRTWARHLHAAYLYVIDGTVGVMLAVIVILTAVQVVTRYLLNLSVPWVNETTRFLFIWLVMVGSGAASARGAHVGFDVVLHRLEGRRRAVAEAAVSTASLLFLAVLTIEGLRLVALNAGQRSPVLGLPISMMYLSIPVGALLCLIGSALAYVAGAARSTAETAA